MTAAKQHPADDVLLGTSAAARLANRSETAIRSAANRGRLPVVRTSTGTRLYRSRDVVAYRQELDERRPPMPLPSIP